MAKPQLAAQKAHHHFDGKDYFVDTAFMRNAKNALKGYHLNHMGFGEFELVGPGGRVQFDQMRGKDFPGRGNGNQGIFGTDCLTGANSQDCPNA